MTRVRPTLMPPSSGGTIGQASRRRSGSASARVRRPCRIFFWCGLVWFGLVWFHLILGGALAPVEIGSEYEAEDSGLCGAGLSTVDDRKGSLCGLAKRANRDAAWNSEALLNVVQ
mmetsp:Transcript_36036/g.78907  ORF Transcript_36036/g.78907 Transcript_36036/m.78907 type:complete len:115 (+) Transcript_36036:484-828(+)